MDVREKFPSEKRLIPWMGSYRSMMDRCYRKTAPNRILHSRGLRIRSAVLENGKKVMSNGLF